MSGQLRVLQVAGWYPPHHIGGTEVYLQGLVEGLHACGVESSILVPQAEGAAAEYIHRGAAVETYPVNAAPEPGELKSGAPHADFDVFRRQLQRHVGAIYHQHSWTRGCGLPHLKAAREMGYRTVVTVHVPSNLCLRGTMMRRGIEPCIGKVSSELCGRCWAQGNGLPRLAADIIGGLPLAAAREAQRRSGRLATALSARALAEAKLSQLAEMIENADQVIAVCAWLFDALAANGVPKSKLTLNRQGVSREYQDALQLQAPPRPASKLLRLLYLGRWHPAKGVDTVVRAVRALPKDLGARLTICAPEGGEEERAYADKVRAAAGSDPRIAIQGPVTREALAETMLAHDVLVVPSVVLETGPLVVLEAQAAGLFVLGSALGGIAELVSRGQSGELVQAGSIGAWSAAIARLASQSAGGGRFDRRQDVRAMSEVAEDMARVYSAL